jgi:tRNA pseudouridine55 synthase
MIFAVYKKRGPTSRDVLNIIKEKSSNKKVGHAGTLDPLAEGVLVVGIGRESTKKLHTAEFAEKEYEAVIKLGEESTTDDREGEKKKISFSKKPKKEDIKKVLSSFVGKINQLPPLFSAVKIEGVESYKWARKGIEKTAKERVVCVKDVALLNYRYPFFKIKVITGRGVYIRSLARDVGKNLGTGGYLYSLKRTRVGEFTVEKCVEIKNFRC